MEGNPRNSQPVTLAPFLYCSRNRSFPPLPLFVITLYISVSQSLNSNNVAKILSFEGKARVFCVFFFRSSMGFPVGYTDVFFPNLFLQALSLLGFIRSLIFWLFRFLGLLDFLETDSTWPEDATGIPEYKPVTELLIQEFLPVMKFQELADSVGAGDRQESCAVCLHEFDEGEEIRLLRNCRHIFHRTCLDRWMDHDQKTCPLCRTQFVPEELRNEFNQRLWAAASGVPHLYSEYSHDDTVLFEGFLYGGGH